jgi:hypothetical protein
MHAGIFCQAEIPPGYSDTGQEELYYLHSDAPPLLKIIIASLDHLGYHPKKLPIIAGGGH